MSGHGGGRRKKHEEHEEHENHERWAVSYADMMTVLMALFLVLFAMSNVDQKKYLELKTSLAEGFGNETLPSDGGSGVVDGSTQSVVDLGNGPDSGNGSSPSTTTSKATAQQAASQEVSSLQELQQRVQEKLEAQGLQDQVTTTITERGLVISVAANNIFFANGSARIEAGGLSVLDTIAPVLLGETEPIAVEGHANTLAMSSGSQYANNWDLSSARASSVLLRLVDDGIEEGRLKAVGYGDAHPLFPDGDPRAVEGNRRVDIVLESSAPDEVKALLPETAKAAQGGAAPAAPAIEAGAVPQIGADAAPSTH